jgi:hypothetical protein
MLMPTSSAGGVQRIHDPEIVPLEVGDLWVDGAVVWERMVEWGFHRALRRAIELLFEGRGATRSNGPLTSSVAGFEAVSLVGGRAHEDMRHAMSDSRWQTHFGATGVFAGASAGSSFLQRHGLSGWVFDLGHTQLKLASGDRFWTFPRDATRLRATHTSSPRQIPTHRRRLREFLALKLQIVMAETGQRPEALLFALPSRLARDGTPDVSDYAGLCGYRELIPDALELAGLADVTAFVLNDAELAAFGTRDDPGLAGYRKILVLTLGFGLGAALVSRAP